jgi:hypothetical protein
VGQGQEQLGSGAERTVDHRQSVRAIFDGLAIDSTVLVSATRIDLVTTKARASW